jgi:hypothetical protein
MTLRNNRREIVERAKVATSLIKRVNSCHEKAFLTLFFFVMK